MNAVLLRLAINSFAIWVTTLVLPQIEVNGGSASERLVTLVIIGAIFGLLNTFLKPLIKLLALPFYVLSLGLFSLVVNAGLLALTALLAGDAFNIGSFFGGALPAAILISVMGFVLHLFIRD
ncbi:MAG: phage holin family protein [Angustibacter sp.]